jgi:hypothetical protein
MPFAELLLSLSLSLSLSSPFSFIFWIILFGDGVIPVSPPALIDE